MTSSKIKPDNIKNINIDNIIATFTDSLKESLDPGDSDKSKLINIILGIKSYAYKIFCCVSWNVTYGAI